MLVGMLEIHSNNIQKYFQGYTEAFEHSTIHKWLYNLWYGVERVPQRHAMQSSKEHTEI
jgi:hypothetical protein